MSRIPELDGWRGISIILVGLGHTVVFRYDTQAVVSFEIAIATLGVKIFFVISGYIITKHALAELEKPGRFSVARFYTRRSFRIIPPLAVYLTTVWILAMLELIKQPEIGLLRAAAFICNIPGLACYWFAGHTWSLAYEEQFYLVFPFVFLWRGRKQVVSAIFLGLLVFPFFRFALDLAEPWDAMARFIPSFAFITCGVVCAFHEQKIRAWAMGSRGGIVTIASLAAVIAVVALQSIPSDLGSRLAQAQSALNTSLLVLAVGWLVASAGHQPDTWLGRFLRIRALVAVGLISYSLYLWQELFSGSAALYNVSTIWFPSVLMFGAAALSYWFIERPCQRAGKGIANQL